VDPIPDQTKACWCSNEQYYEDRVYIVDYENEIKLGKTNGGDFSESSSSFYNRWNQKHSLEDISSNYIINRKDLVIDTTE
jgi:hypothetical protein